MVAEDGAKRYKNQFNQYHNDDGPAIIWADGTKFWYQNGRTHREDGPAILWADGRVEYRLNGRRVTKKEIKMKKVTPKLTNACDPTSKTYNKYCHDNYKYYYVDCNRLHNNHGPAYENRHGRIGYVTNGVYHRLDGPAILNSKKEVCYYINGVEYTNLEYFKRPEVLKFTNNSGNEAENIAQTNKFDTALKENKLTIDILHRTDEFFVFKGTFVRHNPNSVWLPHNENYILGELIKTKKEFDNHPWTKEFKKKSNNKETMKNKTKTHNYATLSKKHNITSICKTIESIIEQIDEHGMELTDHDGELLKVKGKLFFEDHMDECHVIMGSDIINDPIEDGFFRSAAMYIHDDNCELGIHVKNNKIHFLEGPAVYDVDEHENHQFWIEGKKYEEYEYYAHPDVVNHLHNYEVVLASSLPEEQREWVYEQNQHLDDYELDVIQVLKGTALRHNPNHEWLEGEENYVLGAYISSKKEFDFHPFIIAAKNHTAKTKGTIEQKLPVTINESLSKEEPTNSIVLTEPASFGERMKSNAIDALYRSGANNASQALKSIILSQLKNPSAKELQTLKSILDSNFGDMLCSMLLGLGGHYMPKVNENNHIVKIAKECRINAISLGMNELIEAITPAISEILKTMPEDKTRISLKENHSNKLNNSNDLHQNDEEENSPSQKEMHA